MKMSEMTAAIREYPNIHTDLELTRDELHQLYECVAPRMDEEGFRLYRVAKSIADFDLYGSFPYEDARGEFETADGHRLMGYLEAECFGTVDWDIVPGTSYERATSMEVDRESPAYQVFQKQLYETALRDMGFGDLLPPEAPQEQHNKKKKGRDAR